MFCVISLCLISLMAATIGGTNMLSYHIEQQPLDLQPQEAAFWKRDCEHYQKWMNTVIFDDLQATIPLAESALCVSNVTPEGEPWGVNPEKLTVDWLEPEKLVWIHWSTFFHGSGGYVYDGHIVALRDGEKLTAIFKTTFPSYGRGGIADYRRSTMEIRFDSTSLILTVLQIDTDSMSSDVKIPMAVHMDSDNGVTYVQERTIRRVWTYTVQNSRLTYMNGFEFGELAEKEYPLQEVSEGFRVEIPTLLTFNTQLHAEGTCTGTILLNDTLAPYHDDMSWDPLYGDKGHPPWK